MKLRDNQALYHEVGNLVVDIVGAPASDEEDGNIQILVARILDAVDRALTATGPAKLLRNDASMIVAVADKFREARGAGPWSNDNLPGKDTEFARFVLTMVDGWLTVAATGPGSGAPSWPQGRELFELVLANHYVTAVECDHETRTDIVRCACSRWTGTSQPSVGEAIKQWINHVVGILEAGDYLAAVGGAAPQTDHRAAPAPFDSRPRAKCGHVAYRNHDDMCIEDGCPSAAYQVVAATPPSGSPPRSKRPTIAELEAILESETKLRLVIRPDGEIRAVPAEASGSPPGAAEAAPKVREQRCVRCFARYADDGSCSRRAEGCQGGRGEWVEAVASISPPESPDGSRGTP